MTRPQPIPAVQLFLLQKNWFKKKLLKPIALNYRRYTGHSCVRSYFIWTDNKSRSTIIKSKKINHIKSNKHEKVPIYTVITNCGYNDARDHREDSYSLSLARGHFRVNFWAEREVR